jgi:DNA-binding Lrp family transcriptional regulator
VGHRILPFIAGDKIETTKEYTMSQLSTVAKELRRNSDAPGITAAQLAKLTGLSKETVYKRVNDLRVEEGKTIYSNYRTVKGKRTMFYRIAS